MVRTGDICWLEDKYPHDTKDEVWIPDAGAEGWLVVARDKKIRTRPWQRELIRRHGVGCFIINQKQDPTRWQYLQLLAKTIDEMERPYAAMEKPFMYLVDSSGALRDFPLLPRRPGKL